MCIPSNSVNILFHKLFFILSDLSHNNILWFQSGLQTYIDIIKLAMSSLETPTIFWSVLEVYCSLWISIKKNNNYL